MRERHEPQEQQQSKQQARGWTTWNGKLLISTRCPENSYPPRLRQSQNSAPPAVIPAKAGIHSGSRRQVTKKNRSDNTKRRKRDMKADYTPDFARSSRRVSKAETLRYPLPIPVRNASEELEIIVHGGRPSLAPGIKEDVVGHRAVVAGVHHRRAQGVVTCSAEFCAAAQYSAAHRSSSSESPSVTCHAMIRISRLSNRYRLCEPQSLNYTNSALPAFVSFPKLSSTSSERAGPWYI